MRILMAVVALLVVIAGLVLAVLNAGPVAIDLYLVTWNAPLALVLVVVFALGVVVGLLAALPGRWRVRRELARERRRAALHEREVRNLRALPIKEEG